MATDSAMLDRRTGPHRRASEVGPIQSPADPIARGIGLDQPFFDDKNRAFWILQSIGWSGYFFLRTISGFANSKGWMFVVHTLLLTATGYSLTLLLGALFRRLIRLRPALTLFLSLLAVVLASSAFSVIETWSAATFINAALTEGGAERPGGETILAKLSELMLVQAIRMHIEALPAESGGWLGGLRDPLVGRVLGQIHADPARDWSLVSLARAAGLSRSVMAERFTRLVGLPPMTYLARWRMQLAAHALERPGAAIANVAADVGYQSEAAFNRAFKKIVGSPPGLWRRSRQDAA